MRGGFPGVLFLLTATSRTSLLPPFSVFRALRMAGSCSPSNLTGLNHQHTRFDSLVAPLWSSHRGQRFSRTIDDGTNDLMDLAILDRAGAGEPLAQSRGERALDRLEGRVERCRAAKGLRGPQRRASEAAVAPMRVRSSCQERSIASLIEREHTS